MCLSAKESFMQVSVLQTSYSVQTNSIGSFCTWYKEVFFCRYFSYVHTIIGSLASPISKLNDLSDIDASMIIQSVVCTRCQGSTIIYMTLFCVISTYAQEMAHQLSTCILWIHSIVIPVKIYVDTDFIRCYQESVIPVCACNQPPWLAVWSFWMWSDILMRSSLLFAAYCHLN